MTKSEVLRKSGKCKKSRRNNPTTENNTKASIKLKRCITWKSKINFDKTNRFKINKLVKACLMTGSLSETMQRNEAKVIFWAKYTSWICLRVLEHFHFYISWTRNKSWRLTKVEIKKEKRTDLLRESVGRVGKNRTVFPSKSYFKREQTDYDLYIERPDGEWSAFVVAMKSGLKFIKLGNSAKSIIKKLDVKNDCTKKELNRFSHLEWRKNKNISNLKANQTAI